MAERVDGCQSASTSSVPETPADLHTLASLLTWVGERAYYLAAVDQEPFNDEQRLVDALTELWRGAVYGAR